MSERLLLRIAAAGFLLVALGHTVGAMILAPPHGDGETAVLEALASYRFDVMGVERSHAQFYQGGGWFLSLSMIVMTLLTLQLATFVDEHRKLAWHLVLGPLAFAIVGAGLAAKYFFIVPLTCLAVSALALAICFLRLNR